MVVQVNPEDLLKVGENYIRTDRLILFKKIYKKINKKIFYLTVDRYCFRFNCFLSF